MARRTPPMDPAPQANEGAPNTTVPAPALPGGTSGILPTGAKVIGEASAKIHYPGRPESYAAHGPPPPGGAPKIRRYVVQNCPKPPNGTPGFRVVMNGVLAFLVDGKLVDSNMYDVEALKRFGVDLKDIGEV